jgi:hypothetical protein
VHPRIFVPFLLFFFFGAPQSEKDLRLSFQPKLTSILLKQKQQLAGYPFGTRKDQGCRIALLQKNPSGCP